MSQVESDNGFNFGGTLSQILSGYQAISMARIEADKAKFAAAVQNQNSTLFLPEGVNARAAYATGNAVNQNSMGGSNLPQLLLVSALVLGGGFLLIKAAK